MSEDENQVRRTLTEDFVAGRISRREFVKRAILLGLSSSVIGALINTRATSALAATPAAAKPPIKIANIYWQGGGLVDFGRRLQAGAHLAANQINAKGGILGGRMIETHKYDEGFSAEEGLASLKKAVADGCEAVVGFNDSTAALPAQAYCREKRIILTTTGAGTKELTKGTYPGYFRSGFMCQASDRARARWIEQRGFKNVVYLAVDSKYSIDALDDMRTGVWDRPGSKVKLVDVIWVPYGKNEAKLEAAKAVKSKPDFIFTNTWGNDLVVSMAQTFNELGFRPNWTITYDVMTPDLIAALGKLGEGTWHTYNWLHDPSVPQNHAFWAAYKKAFPNLEPDGFTESAYEGMWATMLAINAAGGTKDLGKYDEALKKVDFMTPRAAKIEILPNRESFHPKWLNAQIRGGNLVNLTPMPIDKNEYYVPPK